MTAFRAVMEHLDYDTMKLIDSPEDPDDPNNRTWDEYAEMFIAAYRGEV